jgi:hypothetical protein
MHTAHEPWRPLDSFLGEAEQLIRQSRPDTLIAPSGDEIAVTYGSDLLGEWAEISYGEPPEQWVAVVTDYEGEAEHRGDLLALRLYLDW